MSPDIELHATACAICGPGETSTEIYPASFDIEALSVEVFSARRIPDRRHYRWVRCDNCGLLRSDPMASHALLDGLYADSTFDYSDELDNLRWSYRKVVERYVPANSRDGSLLEVGGGNGFFLQEAIELGFAAVTGVEPSRAALAAADSQVRDRMVCDTMKPGLFPNESFDVVCLFHVVDHLPDPVSTLKACWDALKPNGVVLFVVHDAEAWSARLLGRRSPIIDVEHTYLYTRATSRRLLEQAGFHRSSSASMSNRYSLRYLAQLVPGPPKAKAKVLARLGRSLRRVNVVVPLGNLVAVGHKAPTS